MEWAAALWKIVSTQDVGLLGIVMAAGAMIAMKVLDWRGRRALRRDELQHQRDHEYNERLDGQIRAVIQERDVCKQRVAELESLVGQHTIEIAEARTEVQILRKSLELCESRCNRLQAIIDGEHSG
ncbi:hypothetical protein [Thioalkalivibrio sp. ARh3]|uniref:hypothetical protein n=1 Tax=Thioalkalivibrio sp. ARh3 TaxID=1158148 RepID=UPI00036A8594|nr:hypothetical protein [Thioalkalivibrio sp. ARh3]